MSVLDTPSQPDDDGGINDLPLHNAPAHITREEFTRLCAVVARTHNMVKSMKKAIIGENEMKPDPTSLAMRVEDHERVVRQTRRIAWAAGLGTLALGVKAAWSAIISGGPSHP